VIIWVPGYGFAVGPIGGVLPHPEPHK
jgi:hypothetical protein